MENALQADHALGAADAAQHGDPRRILDVDFVMVVIKEEGFQELHAVPGLGLSIKFQVFETGRLYAGGQRRGSYTDEVKVGIIGGAWRVTMPDMPEARAALQRALAATMSGQRFSPSFSDAHFTMGFRNGTSGEVTLQEFAAALTHAKLPWVRIHAYGMKASERSIRATLDALLHVAFDEDAPAYDDLDEDDLLPSRPFTRLDLAAHFSTALGSVPIMRFVSNEHTWGWKRHPMFLSTQWAPDVGAAVSQEGLYGTLQWRRIKATRPGDIDQDGEAEVLKDFMASNLEDSVASVILYSTIVHVFKHHFRGLNYSKIPGTVRAAKTFASQLGVVMELFTRLKGTFGDMPANELELVRGNVDHALHEEYLTWVHLSGVRVEVTLLNETDLGHACNAALEAFQRVRQASANGYLELVHMPLSRIIAGFWGTMAFCSCTNLFIGDNSARLSDTRTVNSRPGMLLLLRNAASFSTDYSHTFKPRKGRNGTAFFDISKLLGNNDDEIRFPRAFHELAVTLAIMVPCPSVVGLAELAQVVDKARTETLPTLSEFQKADLRDIIKYATRFVEGCLEDIVQIESPDMVVQEEQKASMLELLNNYRQHHQVVDRVVEVRRLLAENRAGNRISAIFGPIALQPVQDWRDLHRGILEDAEQRAFWLGPGHPLPRHPNAQELARAESQLRRHTQASVMAGSDPVTVAKLYIDITAGLQTRAVAGFYTERNKYFDRTRTWYITKTAAPDVLPEIFDTKQSLAFMLYGDHVSKLAWKVLHAHGFCWRARTRLFEPNPDFYFHRLIEVAGWEDQGIAVLAVPLLAGNHAEYADAVAIVENHHLQH